MRLYNREATYEAEHRGSLARKARPPRNLLAWFLEAFRAEMPDRIHASDVWRDRVSQGEAQDGVKAVGGSLLGSPRTSDTFRRYIEDSPFATEVAEYEGHKDQVGHYAFPLRAALARLSGRGDDLEMYPFMARVLYRTALRDGDYEGACRSMGIIEPVRRVYIEEALRRLWTKYEVEPPARPVREGSGLRGSAGSSEGTTKGRDVRLSPAPAWPLDPGRLSAPVAGRRIGPVVTAPTV